MKVEGSASVDAYFYTVNNGDLRWIVFIGNATINKFHNNLLPAYDWGTGVVSLARALR